jgi:hypothetical protein
MKNILFIISTAFIIQVSHAQTDSLYLGQTPPGTTPILFADRLMLGGTALQCARIAISTDGKEIYFTRRNSLNVDVENIQYFKYADKKWNGPFILFPNISSTNLAPTFSPDGDTLYFQIIENNIAPTYFSVRDSAGWTTPQLFKGYSGELYYLQETNNHNFYVAVKNGINGVGNYDICKITFNNGTLSAIQSLGIPLNTDNNDAAFFIAKDESFIVLGRNEDFSKGNRDLYISYKKSDGTWCTPRSLGSKINNGSTLKWGPFVTKDNKYLFYESMAIRWTTWWVRFDGLLDSIKYTNFPPYVKNAIPNQTAIKDSLFNYQVPDSTFFDDDGNNTLTYSATLSNGKPLPGWLLFSAATRAFSGTPAAIGKLTIKVTATDTANASASGTFKITVTNPTGVEVGSGQLPKESMLFQNYPNPFNPSTVIRYSLINPSHVKLTIYDLLGQKIRTLNDSFQYAGDYSSVWDAKDANNNPVASGVYLYHLETNESTLQKKMLLIR